MSEEFTPLLESEALAIFATLLSREAPASDRSAAQAYAEAAIPSMDSYLAYRAGPRSRWAPGRASCSAAAAHPPGFGPFGRLYLDLALGASHIVRSDPASDEQWDAFSRLQPRGDYKDALPQVRHCLPLVQFELWRAAVALAKARKVQHGRGRFPPTRTQVLHALFAGDAVPPSLWLAAQARLTLATATADNGALLPLQLTLMRFGGRQRQAEEPFNLALCPSLLSSLDFFSEAHPGTESAGWWSTLHLAAEHARLTCLAAWAEGAAAGLSGRYLLRWHLEQDYVERGHRGLGAFEELMVGCSHGSTFSAGLLQVLLLAGQRGESADSTAGSGPMTTASRPSHDCLAVARHPST